MFVALVGLIACRVEPEDSPVAPAPPTPWAAESVEVLDRVAVAEVITDTPVDAAVPIAPADLLVSRADRLERVDPLYEVSELAFGIPPVVVASAWQDTLLLGSQDGLRELDGGLAASSLDPLVSDVSSMIELASGLWMDTAEGLVVVRDGVVQRVDLDGTPAQGLAWGRVGQIPVIWTRNGDRAVALTFVQGTLTVIESMQMFGSVEGIAASRDGSVVALVEGWLVRRDAEDAWTRLDVGEPVRELVGARGGPVIWARSDAAWLAITESGILRTDVPLEALDEDDHGRVVAITDAGVTRYSVGYPLLLLGVPTDDILGRVDIQVVPTAPDRVEHIEVQATPLVGEPRVLPIEHGVVTVDGESWAPGLWTLEAVATYADDQEATASVTLEVGGDFVPTWPEHIEPIFQDACTPCHAGGGGVVDLSTEASWITYLEQGTRPESAGILQRVESGNMPPDTRTVGETEQLLLRLWAQSVLP